MAPAAPFNPPSSDLPGKPFVPEWVPPPVTKEKHNFAQLKSIDLSLLDSDDPTVVEKLIQQVKIAIRDDGFLFLENYGVSLEQVRKELNDLATYFKRLTWFSSSSTASSPLPNIYTTISVKRTSSASFLSLTVGNGRDISTHTASR